MQKAGIDITCWYFQNFSIYKACRNFVLWTVMFVFVLLVFDTLIAYNRDSIYVHSLHTCYLIQDTWLKTIHLYSIVFYIHKLWTLEWHIQDSGLIANSYFKWRITIVFFLNWYLSQSALCLLSIAWKGKNACVSNMTLFLLQLHFLTFLVTTVQIIYSMD